MKQFTKTVCLSLALSMMATTAGAQQVNIGQSCPDYVFPRILNYKSASGYLSTFKDKPLLLVFWNTHCSVGIDFLPTLHTLQKQFCKQLQVALVTKETEEATRKTFAGLQSLRPLRFVTIVGDTFVRNGFPHRTEPHIIWIDKTGRVQAITGHEEVTKENLRAFVNEERLDLQQKKENMDNDVYFSRTPLMVNEYPENKSKLLVYSYLGNQRDGILSRSEAAFYNPGDSTITMKVVNSSLLHLYTKAYIGLQPFHRARIILEGGPFPDTGSQKFYCYDLIMKDTSKGKAYKYMQQDLDRCFGITSSMEKRKIKIWVLKRMGNVDRIKAKPGRMTDMYYNQGKLIIQNMRVAPLVHNILNGTALTPYPVIDSLDYSGKIDLEIDAQWNDLSALRRSFKKYDLDIVEEEREVEVIVLRK